MTKKLKIQRLSRSLESLYLKKSKQLLFHGWHHISFVRNKSLEFAKPIDANLFLVESAAICHDLNYIAVVNSEPEAGAALRRKYLTNAGYSALEIKKIEYIIIESHTRVRTKKISKEGMALSDADTLFKALPITPILFASKFLEQNKVSISRLAYKVTSEQNKLMKNGIYFYTPLAKRKYLAWAKINLALWNNVKDALNDKSVRELLTVAKKLKVL